MRTCPLCSDIKLKFQKLYFKRMYYVCDINFGFLIYLKKCNLTILRYNNFRKEMRV